MSKYDHLLSRLGFSEHERTIYLTLLDHPYLTIADIAKYTRYHRPMIYRSIRSLESEQYVEKSLLEGKRYFYHITSPSKLREKLSRITEMADILLPEMEDLHEKNHESPILSIAEGSEGIREIHRDILTSLEKGGEYFIYTSLGKSSKKRALSLPEDYMTIQKKKELCRHIITHDQTEQISTDPYEDIVVMPSGKDTLDENITKLIYANKVAIIDHNSQVGWTIENERFARYEEKIFRLLFREIKKSQKNFSSEIL